MASSPALSPKLAALASQVIRFLAVGGSAAAVDYSILWLGMQAGLSPQLARVPAVAVAVVFTWLLNRTFTFRTPHPPGWIEFGRYLAAAMLGIILNLCLYWTALWLGAPVWLAFVIGTGVTAVFSFVFYRLILHRSE